MNKYVKAYKELGYSKEITMAFMESGIIAVDLSKMQFEERLLYVRSEPINLFARTHDVKRTAFIPNLDTSILLVDTNTGISFYPLKIDNAKILGDGELHFPVDQLRLPIWNYGRSRFRKFPYYLVKTAQELSDVIQTFVKVGSEHFSVLFRGQTKDYQTKRHTVVNCLLYGEDSVLEPNLPSNASRNGYDYFGVESYVRMLLLDINYQITGEKSTLWNVEDEDEFINLIAPEVDAKKKINSSMAIAQHYGIPTYGLDVTSSWEIAWWFATHQHRNINGKVEISNLDWSSKLIDDWPIIYIIRTPNSINLQTINSSALRPIAQSAFFMPGSWGTHSNSCAEDVIAVLKLSPEVGVNKKKVVDVYPDSRQDRLYSELLNYKRELSGNYDFLNFIFEVAQ